MLQRYAERRGLPHRDPLRERERGRRREGDRLRRQGRRRVLRLQVGGRHAPRAARPGDRVAGPDPHLDGHRRGDAGGRGGRDRDRGQGPQDRRLPLDRAGRPVGQHDRLGRPDHARADRDRRLDAGREVAAPEQAEGDARAPRAALRGGARAPAGGGRGRRAARRSAPASAPRRSAPTTSPRTGSPTTAIKHTVHRLDQILDGDLEEFTDALQAEERRRALEAAV